MHADGSKASKPEAFRCAEPGVERDQGRNVGRILIWLVRVYQYLISPLLGSHCRFYPSCSQYTIQAIERHGPIKGMLLSILRLSRCHPWHPGGVDPVPPEKQ